MTGSGFLAGSIVGKLLLDKTGWDQSISSVGKDGVKLKNSANLISDNFQAAGKVMAIAGTAVVGTLGAMIVKAAKYGDEMVEVSQKVGINVTTLSSYKLAADKTGTSIDGMARGLKFLSANIIEASNGTGDGARIFKALGINVVDATGKLRNTDDVLTDVAQSFSGLEGGAVKTTTAVKLFGRSGMDMIPFLNLGADGIKKEREEAERLGLVLSGPAAEAQHEFSHQLTALKDATFGVAVTIGTALIPVVQGAVDSMIKFAAGITSAVKVHPELIKVLGAAGLALGTVGIAVGSVIMLLPRFVAGLAALKTLLGTTALGVGAFTAALTVGVGVIVYYLSKLSELSTAEDELAKATELLRETENRLVDKLSEAAVAAGWNYGRMAALIEVYHGNVAALAMAIKTGKEGVDIQNALADVGKKHALTIEEQKKKIGEMDPVARALNEALQAQKKTTTELTETFTPLARSASFVRDVMQGFAGELTNTFMPAARDMRLVMAGAPATFNEAGSAAGAFSLQVAEIGRQMGLSAAEVRFKMYNIVADINAALGIFMKKLPEVGKQTVTTTSSFMQEVSTVVADSVKEIASALVGLFDFKGLFGAVALDIKFDPSAFDAMVAAANTAFDAVKSAIESSVDAVRSALDKELSGIKSYYDKLEEVAKSAYDKVADAAKASFDKAEESARSAFDKIEKNIRAAYDAFEEAAKAAYDAVEDRINRQQSIEDKARSWHDTFEDRAISRQQEREDRAFSRQYEKEREAIENSKMTRAEKDAALAALARKYEHEQDVREMKRQHEADVRQRAREHADLVRELARERAKEARERAYNKAKEAREQAYDKAREARERAYDKAKEARERAYERAKEARERAFQLKLASIRAVQAAAEQKARETAAKKQAELLADLLKLQQDHEKDIDKIRKDEDLARQKQADDEEKRQGSLWFKVKGIFAQACTSMATIFLTEMLKPVGGMIADLAKKLIGKGKGELGKTFDDVGGNVKGLGKTIGEFISGIGAGIGGFISGLATGVGLAITTIAGAIAGAIVALATGIATAAGILVAALPDLMLIAAAALAIFAGFTIVKGLIDKIFGKKMDTGPMEYWLKLLWELSQNSYNFLLGPLTWFMNEVKNAVTTEIVPTLWHINDGIGEVVKTLYHISSRVDTSTGYLRSITGYLKNSMEYLKTIAEKTASTPFIASVKPLNNFPSFPRGMSISRERTSGESITMTIPIMLDGTKMDERILKIANGRVEWLHSQYSHQNRLIPVRSIGGR